MQVVAGRCGLQCGKGPGEVCGGEGGRYGVCVEGLQCSDCNRCTGCSFTQYICYSDDTTCVTESDHWLG